MFCFPRAVSVVSYGNCVNMASSGLSGSKRRGSAFKSKTLLQKRLQTREKVASGKMMTDPQNHYANLFCIVTFVCYRTVPLYTEVFTVLVLYNDEAVYGTRFIVRYSNRGLSYHLVLY